VDFRRVHPLAGEEEGASGFARGESQLEGSLIALAAGVLERPGKGKHLPGGYPGLLEAPMVGRRIGSPHDECGEGVLSACVTYGAVAHYEYVSVDDRFLDCRAVTDRQRLQEGVVGEIDAAVDRAEGMPTFGRYSEA